jgi:TrmH family RNA methyltransferase
MVKLVTSTSNPELKVIRALREKKYRDESGLFFVEGIRPVMEAHSQRAHFNRIVYCPSLLRSQIANDFIHQISASQENLLLQVDEKTFNWLTLKEGPQGLAAVIHQRWDSFEILSKEQGIWVALDSVQDPGNLGSILRTLDAVGGKGVILLDQGTDVYHPTAVRASMGAIFTMRIIKTDHGRFISWQSGSQLPCYAAVCDQGLDYQVVHYPLSLVLLMGSEQKGLKQDLVQICEGLIRIPMRGRVDSLNLANAASVILYEVYNQQRRKE